MKINFNRKNKIIAGISVAVVCTVLITAGVLKLVNDSKGESSVEVLEKSKISNLFNIKQAEGEEKASSSSGNASRTTASSGRTTTTRSSVAQSSTGTNAKQSPSAKAPSTTPPENSGSGEQSNSGGNTNPPVIPTQPDPSEEEKNEDNKTNEPIVNPPENPTTPDLTSGYTITIDNAIKGHVYEAYQIFQGNLYEKVEDGVKIKVLSDIKWGSDFEAYEADIIKKLQDKYNGVDEHFYDGCKTAADVADVLAKNEAHAKEFSIIIGDIIESKKITTTHKTVDDTYKITGLEAGYYIVIDSQIADRDDAYSRYFLNVVSNVTMEVKSIVPNLGKTVSGGVKIDDTHNTETYYGEDDTNYGLTFNLQAMIPTDQAKNAENDHSKEYLDEYENYEYYIIDIVDKGFDLKKDNSDKVLVAAKDKEGNVLDIDFSVEEVIFTELNKGEYKIDDITPYEEKTIFKITINNLKQQVADGKINPGDIVTFEYKAKLNVEHNVGDIPNINEAYLIYSDNPHNSDSKSRTTENKTYTYSIDLELSKIAKLENADDEKVYLPNAIFEIYDENKENVIAELTTSNEETNKGYAKYTSLSSGTYYIREKKAPDGYNKLNEDVKLIITSELNSDGTIKWNASIENAPELVHLYNENTDGIKVSEDLTYRFISIEIENTSGAQLPITGGIGTVIFTIAGLSIMTIAVICLKSNKRK